jgi:hypothetical protein
MLGAPALPRNHYAGFPLEAYLAAALGLHEEVHRIVRCIPEGHYLNGDWCDDFQRPQLLVLGLGDPQSVVSEMRRLKLVLKTPDHIRGWIAHTEASALDDIRDSILTMTRKDDCAELINVFARVVSPRAAAPMLELMLASKAPKPARDWLELRAGHAIAGLIPIAAGKGKLADAALEYLRTQKRRGRDAFIRECLSSAPPEVAEKVGRKVLERTEVVIPVLDPGTTPRWLRAALDDAAELHGPSWVGPGDLPMIVVGDHALSGPQVDRLLGALARSTPFAPHPLVSAIRANADRGSLDAFARALVERRHAVAAASKEKWVDGALGLLGSEGTDREPTIPAFDPETTPEWLRAALDGAAQLQGPSWVGPRDLPLILVGDRTLSGPQVDRLLGALARSTPFAPHPLVSAIRAHAESRSLNAFAWALFERWLTGGAPPKEKWAMGALGLLGTDATALKLAPMVRAWPGAGQHPRAVFGLECLRAIGSDVALMQLSGIAQKLPFQALKAKAAEMMEAIAQDRGLSRDELEDRIVPDCELDERGSRVFDFGPRQFRFALGPGMRPMVRDEAGQLKDDLPQPTAKDDAAQAAAAVETWKQLKKQVREVAKVQAQRLEQAMVTGRRWSPADFQFLLVHHPLMINLVRLVLWGGYDAAGKLVSTFRITEERDYADVKESTYHLEGIATVGVVHPLHLGEAQRSAWGEIFADYALIPPFPQLGRKVHRLEPKELTTRGIVRNQGIKVPAVTLVGILERHGWNRGVPWAAGLVLAHSKPYDGANVTAVIQYDGIRIGDVLDCPDQEVQKCFFVSGLHRPGDDPDRLSALPLGQVDPVVISEVLTTLAELASKGK